MIHTENPVYFLLVDDLEENLLSLDALLRRDGLVLLKARSGPEALELLLRHDVALALLDVQMPGMDGFELAELMRGTERTRRVPIIFLTAGTADTQRRFRGYGAGAVDFINKPIEPDILRSKADVFFELYLQRRQVADQRDRLEAAALENDRLLRESRQYAAALQETDRRKDEFLATLAHELRNPLAPIRNGLQILRLDPDSKAAEETRGMMERQVTHLVHLIDDLLDVSRISQGKIGLRKEDIALRAAIDAALEASRPLIDAGQHSLTIDLPDAPLWINADLTRLAQIISNLLNNAAKYTAPGGKISLSVRREDRTAVIAVSDNGSGIPADMLPRIFELFTQVETNSVKSQGGLGIGLALVKQLVELHQGAIEAASPGNNQGSTFTMRLPLLQTAPRQLTAKSEPQPLQSNSAAMPLRVLVVDDNISSAKTTGWTLEMIGHQPTLAHDGLEALKLAKQMHPDAILLDIGLPGMNGYEVCRALRQDPQFKHTPIIAQTGWGQERDRREAANAGFTHHLVKPVKLEELAALLSDVKAA
jgi:signal transduction histidine kinase